MANYDVRLAADYSFGQLSAGANALDTTLSSPAFGGLRSDLSPTMYLPITLADDSRGVYETVWVTGHSAGSQNITVVRGREGSTVQTWPAGSTWRCAPTARDALVVVANRGALPGDPHLGMKAYITAETRLVTKIGAGWRADDAPFGHVGMTNGFWPCALGNGAYAPFTTAQVLANGMTFDAPTASLVVPIPGRYLVMAKCYFTGGTNYQGQGRVTIDNNATPPPQYAGATMTYKPDASDYISFISAEYSLTAGQRLRLWQAGSSGWGSSGYDGCFLEAQYLAP